MEHQLNNQNDSKKDEVMFTKYITYLIFSRFGYQVLVFLILISLIMPYGLSRVSATINVLYAKPEVSGNGDCSSWDDACSLQEALAAAESDQEIWVMAGTYTPGTDRTDTFQLLNGVALYGGFNGTEAERDDRDASANPTILSGDIGTVGNNHDNVYHVVTGSGTNGTAILDGFTITLGFAFDYDPNNKGAGMYNDTGSPTLNNVTFTANSACIGGGMYNYNSSPVLINVTFDNNTVVEWSGAGMYNYNSNPVLTNVTFSNNRTEGSTNPNGGGMYNFQSNPILTGVHFVGNYAYLYGGGMYNDISNPILNDVTFMGNSANLGGGMYNGNGFTEINHSDPILNNVTFSANSAFYGGGMYNDKKSNPILTNVTFTGNTANFEGGGGISNWGGNPTLTNVTFSGNTANGMFNDECNPIIRNSIFWGDTNGEIYNYMSSPTISNTIIKGGCPSGGLCTDVLNINPNLAPLEDYGGLTPTMALPPGSPALDAGNDATCPATDQRGVPRPQGAHCDLGAVEYKTVTISGNTGAGRVILGYIDETYKIIHSVESGDYTLTVSDHWTGIVTPLKPCLAFTPVSRSYSKLLVDQTDQDYTAAPNPCWSIALPLTCR
jgi:hypothetical protein